MQDRKTRIINGCKFVGDLAIRNKWESATFKAAGKRLIELLTAELNGESDPEFIFQAKAMEVK